MSENKPTVLLVDDDTDFLFQQQTQLEMAGYQVITAPNENQARKLLAERRPDLAVLDVMMDQPDAGFTLVTGITRETGLEFDVSSAADRAWIRADAMLAKPIRFEQLKREIDRLLGAAAPSSAAGH
jgi:DNA-binding response OmpR family regulator